MSDSKEVNSVHGHQDRASRQMNPYLTCDEGDLVPEEYVPSFPGINIPVVLETEIDDPLEEDEDVILVDKKQVPVEMDQDEDEDESDEYDEEDESEEEDEDEEDEEDEEYGEEDEEEEEEEEDQDEYMEQDSDYTLSEDDWEEETTDDDVEILIDTVNEDKCECSDDETQEAVVKKKDENANEKH